MSHDGRNRLAADGSATLAHDAKGNVTAIGGTGYAYSARNLQYAIPGGFLVYGPLGELDYISASTLNATATLLDYSGQDLTTEYAPGGAILKRYVHGDGVDEPLVEYDASGTRTWLHADERGSIVARSNASGAVTTVNTYDDYGKPGANNVGRFQYTGQKSLPELGMWYYKARMYAPTLGRFMQADPIGYEGGMNLYAYVGGDPVNKIDPSGLRFELYQYCENNSGPLKAGEDGTITVIASRCYYRYLEIPGDPSYFYASRDEDFLPGAGSYFRVDPEPLPRKAKGPPFHGNWCGIGGASEAIDTVDLACKAHDICYAANELSALNNLTGSSSALRSCNQKLCEAVRQVPRPPSSNSFLASEKLQQEMMSILLHSK